MKQNKEFKFPESYRDIAMEYVDYKHSLGFKYPPKEQEKLNSFLSYAYSNSISEPKFKLAQELVEKYAAGNIGDSRRYLHCKQSIIRQFAIFLNLKGIPAYIYPNKNKFINTPLIYPAVTRILYGCGLRIGEALSLKYTDVDLENGILTIMNGKNNVSRLAPISESLRLYLVIYDSKVERGENPYFFPALHNEMYSPLTFSRQFHKLEKQAGILLLSNGRYPRVHDLRHTFSVHALEQMVSRGQDPYCALPILSAYLGHKGIESTEKYLRLTKQYFKNMLHYNEEDAEKIFPEV